MDQKLLLRKKIFSTLRSDALTLCSLIDAPHPMAIYLNRKLERIVEISRRGGADMLLRIEAKGVV